MNTNPLSTQTLNCFSEKTYDKIVKESLILFNDAGFNSVTTAYISKKCDILEGTLWYHFNSKKNILNAHIDLFKKMFLEQIKNINYDKIENVFQTSLNIYSLIWDFQYIFREHFESISIDNDILKKIDEINNYVENFTEELITKSHNHFLKLKKDALNRLIDTILLIGRYWLHFSKKKYPKSSNENLRKKGTKLIFKSLYPFLNKEGKEKMDLMLSKFDIETIH
ncbi:MAG: TetR/AcrR family transcriptional regulator [Flavobacteriaceae bacterium]|jgi:AcrR family transcriptional regulator|nr:TetR/AcrR family transcriptional regulator [Flavobacteriaceae bacterium]